LNLAVQWRGNDQFCGQAHLSAKAEHILPYKYLPSTGLMLKAKTRIILIRHDAASQKRTRIRFDRLDEGHAASLGFYVPFSKAAPSMIGWHHPTEGCRGLCLRASFPQHRRHGLAGLDSGDGTKPWQDRKTLYIAGKKPRVTAASRRLDMASRLHPITKDEKHVRHPSRRDRLGWP